MAKEWKIYTKTGDKGETSLIGGKRVPKFDERIEAYGTIDELNAYIAHIHDNLNGSKEKNTLLAIQNELFVAESILATEAEAKVERYLPDLNPAIITLLETEIDLMTEILPELTSFILPSGHPLVSLCHIARTVCRRAERVCLKLSVVQPVSDDIIRLLNRLSDYLFVLARYVAFLNNAEEIKWKPAEK